MWNKRSDVAFGPGMICGRTEMGGALPMTRRRLLGSAIALLALGGVSRLMGVGAAPEAPSVAVSGGFVVVNGWVLPAKYFRD